MDVLSLLTRQPGQKPTGFNTGDGPGTVSSAMDAFGSTARRNLCGSPFREPLETRLFPATVLTASRSGLGGCGPANQARAAEFHPSLRHALERYASQTAK